MLTGRIGWIRAGLAGLILVFGAGQAAGQETLAPTARELAVKFVMSSDTSPEALLEMSRESVMETLKTKGKTLPQDVKDWMAVAFTAASTEAMNAMAPSLEERLVNVYATKFTAEELQQVLDLQAFLRQPHLMALIAEAEKEANSAAKLEILREGMTAEEFNRFARETLRHPMLTVTAVTMQEARGIAAEFTERFNAALVQYCPTAPKGVAQCERQGRPL